MFTNWQARLEEACSNGRFREFVQRNVLDWCEWRWKAMKPDGELSRLQAAQTEESADQQAAQTEESADQQAARWAAADELESNPRFLPAAVADDTRLTLDAKCALVAVWWYRERDSTALCPTLSPSTDTLSETTPLEVILHIIDIAPDRAAFDFSDIGAIAVDVVDAFEGKLPLKETRELFEFAREKLKGKQRRLVELLIENGGVVPIKDIATDPQIDWPRDDYGRYDSLYGSLQKAVNPKIRHIGWKIDRKESRSLLERWKG